MKELIPTQTQTLTPELLSPIPENWQNTLGLRLEKTTCLQELQQRATKARTWASINLKEGVKYSKIEILSAVYNLYGRRGASKKITMKLEEAFSFLEGLGLITYLRKENLWFYTFTPIPNYNSQVSL